MNKSPTGIILYRKKEKDLTEADYSVNRLLEACRNRGISCQVIAPEQFEIIVSSHDQKRLLIDDQEVELPDFVIPRLGSYTTYYGFAILRELEHRGVYIANNARAIYNVQDKLLMHQILANSQLASPKTMLAKFPLSTDVVKREIGFPLVIKNVIGSQGIGIYLCEKEEKFQDILDLIYSNNNKANLILQEYIQESHGRDLRIFIIGGQVVGCMQRSSEKSFKANFSKGAAVQPFEASAEIQWLSTEVAKLFELDIGGIDLLFDKEGFKVCEANSSPGFIGLEQVYGKVIAEQIIDYILIKIGACLETA